MDILNTLGKDSNTRRKRNTKQTPKQNQNQNNLPQQKNSVRTNLVFLKKVDLTGKMYTDQTWRFPITSTKSYKYILVAYHYDSNTIHAEPLKTQTLPELKSAYHKIHTLLTNRGLQPSLHIVDNECPNVLKIHEMTRREISVSPSPHPSQKFIRTGHPEF